MRQPHPERGGSCAGQADQQATGPVKIAQTPGPNFLAPARDDETDHAPQRNRPAAGRRDGHRADHWIAIVLKIRHVEAAAAYADHR